MGALFTLTAVAARIAALVAEEEGPAPRPNHGLEKLALAGLGLTLPVASLAEAAVLCDLAFGEADALLASEVDLPEALQVVEQLRRAMVCIGRAICSAAELDPEWVAWGQLDTAQARDVMAGVAA
ncbi:MAG: hypothetical protein ACRYHQ_20555 [Janthinobacterium lividum]